MAVAKNNTGHAIIFANLTPERTSQAKEPVSALHSMTT